MTSLCAGNEWHVVFILAQGFLKLRKNVAKYRTFGGHHFVSRWLAVLGKILPRRALDTNHGVLFSCFAALFITL